jgi:Holliday junction resolvase RusA-like endonuclease
MNKVYGLEKVKEEGQQAMIQITIPMRLPGLNEYVNACRGNKYEAANFKQQVENDCLVFIRAALRGRKLNSIGIVFTWIEKNRQRDKDNICFAKKFILDAMQKGQVLKNDGWNQVQYFRDEFAVDKDKPRVEVLIEEIG